jgi:hypothetical protein
VAPITNRCEVSAGFRPRKGEVDFILLRLPTHFAMKLAKWMGHGGYVSDHLSGPPLTPQILQVVSQIELLRPILACVPGGPNQSDSAINLRRYVPR